MMGYIDAPGLREELALKKANKAIDTYVESVNTFFANDWKTYQQQVEEKELNFFSALKN